jgi:transcriptional regulator GlxA family with amidase domain
MRAQEKGAGLPSVDTAQRLPAACLQPLIRRDPRGELHWVWRRITAECGTTCIENLAREIGWSRRHLSERFRVEIGVTPKTLARIARFERACALLKRAPGKIADIAVAAGYHDQSHLTRDWWALGGCTPKTWIKEELPFVQDYELAGLDNESR